MSKLSKLFILMLLFCAKPVYAGEEAVVSLFDGTPEAVVTKPTTSTEEEEGGLFSFLNFKLPENILKDKADKKNLPDTIEETIKLADKGNLEAQLLLGYSYLYGDNGLKPDYAKAFEYYGKAALQNDATGLNNLGSLYYSGIGVARNPAKAAVLFAKAAELGNAEAAVNIGFMHISGNGAKQDKLKALNYFEQASATDNPTAKFMTGYAYYTGSGRHLNYVKAAPLIKAAADAGLDEAQLVLADMYIGGKGFPQNYQNAVRYLRLSATQGNTEAMMNLADILAEGEKYKKDVDFAHVLYNLAAVRGVTSAPAKRQAVESKMKIGEVLQAQTQAENFMEKPSQLSSYIRQTFGANVRSFIK